MKKTLKYLTIFFVMIFVGWLISFNDWRKQQTCSLEDARGISSIVELAHSGDAQDVFTAAEAFYGGIPDGGFDDPLPSDVCFAETLFVKAANMGSADALERLREIYSCENPMAFGTSNRAAEQNVRHIIYNPGEPYSLESNIFLVLSAGIFLVFE